MTVEVANCPVPSVRTNQQLIFGTGLIVNATSVIPLPTSNRACIILMIPSASIVQTITPQVIIMQGSTSVLVPFPSSFSFTEPPQVTIQSFFPTRAAITQPGSILPVFAYIVGIQSSDHSTTTLRVRMPSVSVLSGVLDVQVSVRSATNEKKLTGSLSFRYIHVVPSLKSVSPTIGTSLRGTTVNLQISNFRVPSNLLPLRIIFQTSVSNSELQQGSGLVSLTADALGNSVYLTLLTPPSVPGLATLVIYSLMSGKAEAIQFDFQVLDASSPEVDLPLPSSACLQNSGTTFFIYLKQATSPQSLDAIAKTDATVQFRIGTDPVMVSSISQLSNGRVRLAVAVPNSSVPLSFNLNVKFGVYALSPAISFSLTDCSIPGVVSVSPNVVLNIGGNIITIVLQNIPPLTASQLAVILEIKHRWTPFLLK